ncbi:hypothetical protein LC605_25115 [Nostoc sp. CHAB 5836]|uniref:hypothetical protein n=1 Tax=Nostoc sp. CHAB 5836 TaxID=2780404 RepID=UPI001E33F8D7|nr:hypothetical protein [Nostoc sp. CHAB 5836]MCC5618304.1 hypothetical protein [Nostoc sp. CHAB 5836]
MKPVYLQRRMIIICQKMMQAIATLQLQIQQIKASGEVAPAGCCPTFNINFQITDLPTGQLAEAQITQFDQYDRPNGGTILIDDDANGYLWFIDPTPLDNSEFAQTLADTALRATTGDAVGKYDLLTTILHETGHLLVALQPN